MDITKITDLKELKSMHYDELVKLERTKNNIQFINQRIAELERDEANKPDSEPAHTDEKADE